MKILVIDNYDSFTYNLVHRIKETGLVDEIRVQRNDAVDESFAEEADAIICSPGPGIPEEAGELMNLIRRFGPRKPLLGVCLGLQAIAEVYGGRLRNLPTVFHGVSTTMQVVAPEEGLFDEVPELFEAGRYHSWVIDADHLPEVLEVTAIDEGAQIMAVKHREHPVWGVQFHPESVLTPEGGLMLKNFVTAVADRKN